MESQSENKKKNAGALRCYFIEIVAITSAYLIEVVKGNRTELWTDREGYDTDRAAGQPDGIRDQQSDRSKSFYRGKRAEYFGDHGRSIRTFQ